MDWNKNTFTGLATSVHGSLAMFGQMSVPQIIQKLKMRNIEASEKEVLTVCEFLINQGKIRVSDYSSEVLVPITHC